MICGSNNCPQSRGYMFPSSADCCTYNCDGKNEVFSSCCSNTRPCKINEGDCDTDEDCEGNLVCGSNNCPRSGYEFSSRDDCCTEPRGEANEMFLKIKYKFNSFEEVLPPT